jgi:hypothetical protein
MMSFFICLILLFIVLKIFRVIASCLFYSIGFLLVLFGIVLFIMSVLK